MYIMCEIGIRGKYLETSLRLFFLVNESDPRSDVHYLGSSEK